MLCILVMLFSCACTDIQSKAIDVYYEFDEQKSNDSELYIRTNLPVGSLVEVSLIREGASLSRSDSVYVEAGEGANSIKAKIISDGDGKFQLYVSMCVNDQSEDVLDIIGADAKGITGDTLVTDGGRMFSQAKIAVTRENGKYVR